MQPAVRPPVHPCVLLPAVQLPHGVGGVPRVLELHEGEAGGIPGHPDAAQGPVITKGSLQLRFIPIVPKIPYIDLTVQRAVAMHDGIWEKSEKKTWFNAHGVKVPPAVILLRCDWIRQFESLRHLSMNTSHAG